MHKSFSTDDAVGGDNGGRGRASGSKPLQSFLCGGIAGVTYWASIFPIDLAKTRIQTSASKTSVLCEMRSIARKRGWRGLYAGMSPTIIRAFPANAAQWMAWDILSHWS
mmetsp:Transcript_7750/g.19833  ORF Transcript_7750/g.19833 Transcript_7750/m.19833 type:complete len:109 (+) Transcript_7750:335-661(+)